MRTLRRTAAPSLMALAVVFGCSSESGTLTRVDSPAELGPRSGPTVAGQPASVTIAATTALFGSGWSVNNNADWTPFPPNTNPLGAPNHLCTGASTPTGSWAEFTFAGFSIPGGDVVTGIEVRVNYLSASGSNTVQLTDDGSLTGNSKTVASVSAQSFCSNTAWVSAGGAADLWGTTLTTADFNAGTVGFRLTQNANTVDLDAVELIVHHEPEQQPENPAIDVEKATEGQDADAAPGPYVLVGETVSWAYVVTNTGDVALSSVGVSDDIEGAASCPQTTLAVGESMTCNASGTAASGQYENEATASGTSPAQTTVDDTDPSHYFGADPGIDIEKSTEGQDADAAPGPTILAGQSVGWTYEVENTGNVTLTGIAVSDDEGVSVSCPESELDPGESMTCTGSGTTGVGQYDNVGTATGTPPGGLDDVSDTDPSHYFGAAPSIDIEKATNGEDADDPPGVFALEGDPVSWSYEVTNDGNVALSGIAVVDDQGVTVSCPASDLAPGASMTCTAAGTVELGQYANTGSVSVDFTDDLGNGTTVEDQDPSHYFGFVTNRPSLELFDLDGEEIHGSFVIQDASSGSVPHIGVTNLEILVQYRTPKGKGGTNQWLEAAATCSFDPAAQFVFSGQITVDLWCTLDEALPAGATVRLTASVNIFNRGKTFWVRTSKR